MIKFRESRYSSVIPDIIESAVQGSTMGATVGSIVYTIRNILSKGKKDPESSRSELSKSMKNGALIGGSLAILYSSISKVLNSPKVKKLLSWKVKNPNYNIKSLSRILSSKGYTPDSEFTTNPRVAESRKFDVNVLIKSDSDILMIVVSSSSSKFIKSSEEIIESIPGSDKSSISSKVKDSYVEITIMSSNGGDLSYVSNVVSTLIENGLRVFLVEVNDN